MVLNALANGAAKTAAGLADSIRASLAALMIFLNLRAVTAATVSTGLKNLPARAALTNSKGLFALAALTDLKVLTADTREAYARAAGVI